MNQSSLINLSQSGPSICSSSNQQYPTIQVLQGSHKREILNPKEDFSERDFEKQLTAIYLPNELRLHQHLNRDSYFSPKADKSFIRLQKNNEQQSVHNNLPSMTRIQKRPQQGAKDLNALQTIDSIARRKSQDFQEWLQPLIQSQSEEEQIRISKQMKVHEEIQNNRCCGCGQKDSQISYHQNFIQRLCQQNKILKKKNKQAEQSLVLTQQQIKKIQDQFLQAQNAQKLAKQSYERQLYYQLALQLQSQLRKNDKAFQRQQIKLRQVQESLQESSAKVQKLQAINQELQCSLRREQSKVFQDTANSSIYKMQSTILQEDKESHIQLWLEQQQQINKQLLLKLQQQQQSKMQLQQHYIKLSSENELLSHNLKVIESNLKQTQQKGKEIEIKWMEITQDLEKSKLRLQQKLQDHQRKLQQKQRQIEQLKDQLYQRQTANILQEDTYKKKLLQAHQQFNQELIQQHSLLQEEIQSLKAKIRYLYQKYIKSRHFRSICMLQHNSPGNSFLKKIIEELYGNSKKIAETQIVYKFSQFTKIFSFLNLLPKKQLLSECHVFLFGTKTNKFGAVSFKKDAVSKQSALIFSITNKKIVSKKSSADALHSFGVGVDTYGALTIGGTHWLMKASTRNLIVKDSLNKYFEPYDKKEVFGPQFWREDLNIELTEFQIHRVLLK